MEGTILSLLPALIAIALALLTKQVYVSLFLGILTGAMFVAGGNPIQAMGDLFIVMSEEIGSSGTILVFLVMLGILVVLMTKAGGSRAYGDWAGRKIKSKKGAMGATAGLGVLIFVDDYFNCLTVGSVMRPVTDKFKISRTKLAYLIDSTAAPICIIAPISSWAAAVSAKLPAEVSADGFSLFLQAIPFNLYALLTIIMVVAICFLKFDFGKMRKNEAKAQEGDLFAGETDVASESIDEVQVSNKGKVIDLVVPVIVLIVFCISSMIYVGYFLDWNTYTLGTTPQVDNVISAFSECDAGLSLAIGSTFTIIFTVIFYMIRRVLSFKSITESFVQGFKSMVPAILILVLAWTLGTVSGKLGIDTFVNKLIDTEHGATWYLPAIIFVIALFISFATGTSWGTFGILIPILCSVFSNNTESAMFIICLSAILAGSVCGDHISPISDTTILASSGAGCNHVDHVNTQLPYALTVAGVSFLGFVVAGLTQSLLLTWAVSLIALAAVVVFVKMYQKKNGKQA